MAEPSVRAVLLAKLDEQLTALRRDLDEITATTDQLEPSRAAACRTAIEMTRIALDELRTRAHTPGGFYTDTAPGDIAGDYTEGQ